MIWLLEPATMVNTPAELTVNRSNPITAYTMPAISHIPRIGFANPAEVNVLMPGQRRREAGCWLIMSSGCVCCAISG